MAQYDVILEGGDMIAVVPEGTEIDPETLRVYLYDTFTKQWKGKRHVQSVLAHGNYWVEPAEPKTITIDKPIPEVIERMQ